MPEKLGVRDLEAERKPWHRVPCTNLGNTEVSSDFLLHRKPLCVFAHVCHTMYVRARMCAGTCM